MQTRFSPATLVRGCCLAARPVTVRTRPETTLAALLERVVGALQYAAGRGGCLPGAAISATMLLALAATLSAPLVTSRPASPVAPAAVLATTCDGFAGVVSACVVASTATETLAAATEVCTVGPSAAADPGLESSLLSTGGSAAGTLNM